ncbi:hypothetical protein GL267_007300 [Acidithiobacillus ferrianus]|uniref:Uncharacterized protein n=2 Tax=Acidithiobacillus ferrianus TaxID=2678518 RepID=A0A845U7E8_9PROT|nr:hypothetical protein [Acidithiobacillus ferrianus]NDU42079.1 hypothetical protein [Acidithiobacillus ferrianus]
MVDIDSDNPWEATEQQESQIIETKPEPVEMETGLDLISDILPSGEFKQFVKWTQSYRIGQDDPFFGNVLATRVAFQSAAACGHAAAAIQEELKDLPSTIQNAVILGAGDIKGEVKQAFNDNVETLKTAIAGGIKGGAKISIDALNLVNGKFIAAIEEFDSKVDKAIIQHKDQVLANWVQSGSEDLNKRIRAEVKQARVISFGILFFMVWVVFFLGFIAGVYLSHHPI